MQRPSDLKVGDAFRVISAHSRFTKGDIVYLIHDDGTNMLQFSKNKNDEPYAFSTWWVHFHRLEPLETAFEVGDIVRDSEGDVGVVVFLGEYSDESYQVYYPNWDRGWEYFKELPLPGDHCVWLSAKHLTLISKAPEPKTGDKCLIIGNGETESLLPHSFDIGDVVSFEKKSDRGNYIFDTQKTLKKAVGRSHFVVLPREEVSASDTLDVGREKIEIHLCSDKAWTAYTSLVESTKQKGGLMSYIKTIPTRLKRVLNADLRAMYQVGWIDGDLDPTDDGQEAVIDFIFTKFEKELGELAKAELKDRKKQEKEE